MQSAEYIRLEDRLTLLDWPAVHAFLFTNDGTDAYVRTITE